MKSSLAALLLITASTSGNAHDFWVQPTRFQVPVGQRLGAVFWVGHSVNRQRWGNGPDKIVGLTGLSEGKREDERIGLRPSGPNDLITAFDTAGVHILAMQTAYSFSELPAIRFNDFVKQEGMLPAINERKRTGTSDKPGRERYSRRAKAMILVGPPTAPNQAFATRPIGMKLEIVPELNPFALDASRKLPVYVLYQGRRLANATVKFTDLDQDDKPLAVSITDHDGRAAFQVPSKGKYLINVIWTEPLRGDPKADFDTTFSSLTFGYDG